MNQSHKDMQYCVKLRRKLFASPILALSLILSLLASGIASAHAEDQKQMMNGKMEMMKSSPNAKKAPYDLQFIDTMIQHHQGAIEMAQMALDKAQNPTIKKMAKKMVNAQQKEITEFKKIRDKSYANKPEAVNMDFPGMMDSMKGMDMEKLEKSSAQDFDINFINMMIPHHQGAISMAQDALKNASNKKIKEMAQNIIKNQGKEVTKLEKIRAELKTGNIIK